MLSYSDKKLSSCVGCVYFNVGVSWSTLFSLSTRPIMHNVSGQDCRHFLCSKLIQSACNVRWKFNN